EIEEQAAHAEHRDSITTYRTVWPDGTVRWIESKGRALHASDGTLVRVTGTSMDITERKNAEEALQASEERFRSVVQNASDVIVIVEADGSIVYVSPAAERVWGHTPDSLRGGALLALVHADDRAAAQLHLEDALLQVELNVATELRLCHAD